MRHAPHKKSQRDFARTRVILRLLAAVYLLSLAVFLNWYGGTTGSRFAVYFPWGLFAIYISFYIFWEYNRIRKQKREDRRQYMNERTIEILEGMGKGGRHAGANEK